MASKKGNASEVSVDNDDAFDNEPADAEDVQGIEDLAKELQGQGLTSAPDGFEQVGAEQSPFAVKRPGAVVFGTLIGRFERKRKRDAMGSPYFYQVRLRQPCIGTTGSKKKGTQKVRIVKPGEIISIDESEAMKAFETLAEETQKFGARYDVWIKFKEKISLDSGQSFWDLEKKSHTVQAPKYPADFHGRNIPA